MKTTWPAFRCGCLILAGAVLGANPAGVRGQEAAGANTSAVISSVAITQEPQRAAIRVEGAGRLEVHAARMQNPERLVLDFEGARLGVQRTIIAGVAAPVRGVRLGQYRPDVARVVIDLTASAPYQISHEGNALVIYVQALTAQTEGNNAAPVRSAEVTPKKELQYTASAPRLNARASKFSNLKAPKFSLPSELAQSSLVLASMKEKTEPARPESSGQQAAQQASSAAATMAASQSSANAANPGGGRYTGEPISVNLKDVDLKDFFRLIHEISGLNVVLDPNVKGSLTIVLDEVPWDQALDIVLQNNSLDKQLEGNVLRIATVDTLRKEAEAKRAQQEAEALAVDKVTVTRFLSYAHSKDVVPTIKSFLTQRGDVISDDRTNALIIQDIPSVMPAIDRLLTQLDRKTQEVEIEARVVA